MDLRKTPFTLGKAHAALIDPSITFRAKQTRLIWLCSEAPSTRIRIFLKTEVFSPVSKKSASTRSVFKSFLPAHDIWRHRKFENLRFPLSTRLQKIPGMETILHQAHSIKLDHRLPIGRSQSFIFMFSNAFQSTLNEP